ncbi:hypothetical protein [Seohaeicola zhoushanensis]|uniref:Uncharacterized protein n=1 Tax=Seohaeicola zhoushanensis TaxID=1569283 RepID=A0A8J3GTW9_9RHOB|nr:hypothetical protein [Seohaeicola zhoushanensis]GHF33220.1 hypothetical protein GCM10017056_00790 [Seohaeicola zhoushanensis]
MTTKTTKAPAKAKKLDLPRLERLAAEIAPFEKGGDKTDLLARLETEEGLKVKAAKGVTTVTMAGIEAKSPRGLEEALYLWGNKARRAVNAGAVA